MKTLDQIKNEVAKDYGYHSFKLLQFEKPEARNTPSWLTAFHDKVTKRYAQKCCEDLRERISAEVYEKYNGSYECKQIILNLPIELP